MKNMAFVCDPFRRAFGRFMQDETGTTAIEYALIAAGISVAIVTVVSNIGSDVNDMFVEVQGSF